MGQKCRCRVFGMNLQQYPLHQTSGIRGLTKNEFSVLQIQMAAKTKIADTARPNKLNDSSNIIRVIAPLHNILRSLCRDAQDKAEEVIRMHGCRTKF